MMLYIYLLESIHNPDEHYIGSTKDLKNWLLQHNSGESAHTQKFRPWRIVAYFAFTNFKKAADFEKYLKSGSGHAFAKRHFW